MKDYLNNGEIKELIVLSAAQNIVDHFREGNVMTSKEKGDLKRGLSNFKNAISSVLNRLGETQETKFYRTLKNSSVIAITDSELEVLQKRKSADKKAAYEDSKEYFELVELIMDKNCRNCTEKYQNCTLFSHFDTQEIIPFDEDCDLCNCKFAYKK